MWEAGEEGFSGWYEEPERRDEGYREKSQPKMCIRWERDLYSWNNVNLPQRVFFFVIETMLCPLEKLWVDFCERQKNKGTLRNYLDKKETVLQ
ncbi:hypothetical protein NC653_030116 [Populus alba x Populus x berolinensis]|uniref:Uncharacterized protein n=1 Tax=Populus alba x Populus x berolinensis TaxID=444605 RepID=A0AAD6LVB9_9ROSI|nr:hypothetical protein NC653_030116 [Populus alba x Populus x berolinensis]